MRYLTPCLQRDLKKKLVFLSGPRQVGKSTLAKSLLGARGTYLNWDIREHRRLIREVGWEKKSSLVVLDELHKLPKWKSFLKGVIDEHGNRPPTLVTGSARLEILRRGGDALTGRTYHYRLHPIDVAEAQVFLPGKSRDALVDRLLETGGFPEAFLHPREAERLRNDRLDIVLRDDLRDVSKTTALHALGILVDLLRERVGGQVSFANLAEDLSVSSHTVKSWIGILEGLYLTYRVQPYAGSLARSLRKEPKVYFYDCAAAFTDSGPRLENLVACALLKHCHLQHDARGRRMHLHYFRDREKREVDFVVTENGRVKWCIEVKEEDDHLHRPLAYLRERLKPAACIQLVRRLTRRKEVAGVGIVPLADWLAELPAVR
jgi:hypothetical protein